MSDELQPGIKKNILFANNGTRNIVRPRRDG